MKVAPPVGRMRRIHCGKTKRIIWGAPHVLSGSTVQYLHVKAPLQLLVLWIPERWLHPQLADLLEVFGGELGSTPREGTPLRSGRLDIAGGWVQVNRSIGISC
eukprot:1195042-Prorocentrum_minimum.AAC.1